MHPPTYNLPTYIPINTNPFNILIHLLIQMYNLISHNSYLIVFSWKCNYIYLFIYVLFVKMVAPITKKLAFTSSIVQIIIAKITWLSFVIGCNQLWLTWTHFSSTFASKMHNNHHKCLHLQLQISIVPKFNSTCDKKCLQLGNM
jgi:hypothetical protein